jgi:hypothetical protein
MSTVTLQESKLLHGGVEIIPSHVFWRPCTPGVEMAVLLATTDKKVVCAKKSWLRDPRYNKEEDENVVFRVNNYFSQFLDAHTHITPNLLFAYGTGTVHYDETHVVNFLQETVKEHPKHLLLQRTSCTSTFDGAKVFEKSFRMGSFLQHPGIGQRRRPRARRMGARRASRHDRGRSSNVFNWLR